MTWIGRHTQKLPFSLVAFEFAEDISFCVNLGMRDASRFDKKSVVEKRQRLLVLAQM
jgi:hypothetical protein